jgi:hypothetical protein
LNQVGRKATSLRRTFSKSLAQIQTTSEEEACSIANSTTEKHEEWLIWLPETKTDTTVWSIADIDYMVTEEEIEILIYL